MLDFLIDHSKYYAEGGSCQFYLLNQYNIGFKEFSHKDKAIYAYDVQTKLTKFNLAPRTLSSICRLNVSDGLTEWGYLTEVAQLIDYTENRKVLSKIQELVNNIFSATKLKFWDCHFSNIGTIKRNRSKHFVCIDTGRESFNSISNAWGNTDPGPKCSYCNSFRCKCKDHNYAIY